MDVKLNQRHFATRVPLRLRIVGSLVVVVLCSGIQSAGAAPANGPPLIVTAAKQLGLTTCYSKLEKSAKTATAGAEFQNIMLNWNRKSPNEYPTYSVTAFSDGNQRALLTIAAVPLADGECSIESQTVSLSNNPCYRIASQNLTGFIATKLIDGVVVYSKRGQPGDTYILVDQGAACLVSHRQVDPGNQDK